MYMQKKWFTLVEVSIVIVVIALLFITAVTKIRPAQERARDSARSAYMRDVYNALWVYHADKWAYPILSNINVFSGNISFLSWSLQKYITNIPKDPIGKGVEVFAAWWHCADGGEYFAYNTDYQWKKFTITSTKESKKWNTSNCKWLVDRDQTGIRESIWIWMQYYEVYYDWTENPIEWCKKNLTQDEVNVLNTIQWWTNSIASWCAMGTINRRNKWLQSIPSWIQKLVNLQYLYLDTNSAEVIKLAPTMNNLRHLYLPMSLKKLLLPTSMPVLTNLMFAWNQLEEIPEFIQYWTISYMNISPSPNVKYLTPMNCQYIASFPYNIRWHITNYSTLCPWY